MKFKEFATYLERLETTPKRLEITDILVELIGKLTHEETPQAVYLSLGYLKAPFENRVFINDYKEIEDFVYRNYNIILL